MVEELNLSLRLHKGWMLVWMGVSCLWILYAFRGSDDLWRSLSNSTLPIETYCVWRLICAFVSGAFRSNSSQQLP
jgi:hypothetical protein